MSRLTQDRVQQLYQEYGDLKVLDDIIRHRANDELQAPILGYPKYSDRIDEYEGFTGKQLDCFVDGAVKKYISLGLESGGRGPVGLLAPSNVDYVVSVFALSRLGYTPLCLSLRIPPPAILNLLKQTGCTVLVHGAATAITDKVAAVASDYAVKSLPIPTREDYDSGSISSGPRFERSFDREEENTRPALIMHSSGSTGLPKPVTVSHRALLTHALQGAGMHNFNPLPWYHLYGVSTCLQAMYRAKTANMYSATMPLTTENLVLAVRQLRPDAIHVVPYVLGLLAETPEGVAHLKSAKMVTSAGAKTPDELGDRLVGEGVNLAVVFGTTEAGLAGDTMGRAPGDDSWNYVRFYAYHRSFIHMDPLGDGLFEAVYLPGHPGLSTSNSDSPVPGSWRSKDVFAPHPTIPDAWKCITRLDDRVTLVTGEKVLPLPIEGRIRQHPLVREAVVVGIERPVPGLLLFRASDEQGLSDGDYLDAVWPAVEEANAAAEAFSQISRDMVAVLGAEVDYPRTDKGSIIRAQVYNGFAQVIDDLYTGMEDGTSATGDHEQKERLPLTGLGLDELVALVAGVFQEATGRPLASEDADFFAAGVDSLQALQMRRALLRRLDLQGRHLPSNIVYESGSGRALARFLHSLGQGQLQDGEARPDAIPAKSQMEDLISKYGGFGKTVLLTGATGSIGAHVLAQLITSPSISRVFCLVRSSSSPNDTSPPTRPSDSSPSSDPPALNRIHASLRTRRLTHLLHTHPTAASKIHAHTGDPSLPQLGLDESVYADLASTCSLVIHLAWPVHFGLGLGSFEPHVRGLRALLAMALEQRGEPAVVLFGSSVGVAGRASSGGGEVLVNGGVVTKGEEAGGVVVREESVPDLGWASPMGYAQSKLVGEHMVLRAAREAGARAYVLRVGQVVGDAAEGVWNEKEFVPSLIRSVFFLRALPALDETCAWLPVDTLATAIVQLADKLDSAPRPCHLDPVNPPIFYNMVNPASFGWSDLLRVLRSAPGIPPFAEVSPALWLAKLRASAALGQEERNPAVKLLDYYEEQYGAEEVHVANGVGGVRAASRKSAVVFDTTAAQRDCPVLRNPPKVLEDGYIEKFLKHWLENWKVVN
ncbi:putative NRPS-like enzyme [Chaetomium fimeti]|uniref:NRPS-like enzyme n=1 Tax=Chaetomium fimeti TaxID=1854472 RepID=A0AAE0HPI5_9PEZI|nr:putative NRPS-like enzyme [Chaetomium fimeti]